MPFNFDGLGVLASIAAGAIAAGFCAVVLIPVGTVVAWLFGTSLLVGANIGAGISLVVGGAAGLYYHRNY